MKRLAPRGEQACIPPLQAVAIWPSRHCSSTDESCWSPLYALSQVQLQFPPQDLSLLLKLKLKSVWEQQLFLRKKPYFCAIIFCLVFPRRFIIKVFSEEVCTGMFLQKEKKTKTKTIGLMETLSVCSGRKWNGKKFLSLSPTSGSDSNIHRGNIVFNPILNKKKRKRNKNNNNNKKHKQNQDTVEPCLDDLRDSFVSLKFQHTWKIQWLQSSFCLRKSKPDQTKGIDAQACEILQEGFVWNIFAFPEMFVDKSGNANHESQPKDASCNSRLLQQALGQRNLRS